MKNYQERLWKLISVDPHQAHLLSYLLCPFHCVFYVHSSSQMLSLTAWPHVLESLFVKWWGEGWMGGGSYLCHIEWAVSPVLPGGKALLLGCMAHVSLLCCHDKGGKLISSGLSRKILWLAVSWEGSLHEARPPHAPFVCLPHSVLYTLSFALFWNVGLSMVGLSWLHVCVSSLVCSLTLKKKTFTCVCPFSGIYWCPVTVQSSPVWGQYTYWLNLLFLSFCARPGLTQGYPLLWCHRHIRHCSLGGSKSPGGQLQGHLCASSWRSVSVCVTLLHFPKTGKIWPFIAALSLDLKNVE